MKRISIICLALCLTAMFLLGCGPQTQQPPEATAETDGTPAAEATPEPVIYTEPVNALRLDSIDYDQEKDAYLLNVTPIAYTFGEAENSVQSHTAKEGESKQLVLGKDAVVDFPLLDNLAQTVTLLPGELAEEYLAYVEKYDEKPLFIAEESGNTVTRLTHFYLP